MPPRKRAKEANVAHQLTPRQLEILRLIRDGRRQRGVSPTMQELADTLGITKVTVFEHVDALVEKGLLLRLRHKPRSLELTSEVNLPDERPTCLPLVGRIAAGRPLEAVEDRETIDLEEIFASRGKTFALRVNGDSMIDDQIRDGDYVVVEQRDSARNGETVVALLKDGEATLKRFYREKNRIRLEPANAAFKPIYVDNIDLQGVVVGVIRRL